MSDRLRRAVRTLVALAVAGREPLLEAARYQRREIGPALRAAAVVTLVETVSIAGIAPAVIPLSSTETASAGTVADTGLDVAFTDGSDNLKYVDYAGITHRISGPPAAR